MGIIDPILHDIMTISRPEPDFLGAPMGRHTPQGGSTYLSTSLSTLSPIPLPPPFPTIQDGQPVKILKLLKQYHEYVYIAY